MERPTPTAMPVASTRTDEDLLGSDDPEDFGVFYDRHIRGLLGYFVRRTGDPEVAADLAAETFASALVSRRRFRPGGAPAGAWLYTIAQRRLADYHRRGRVDDRVRRTLEMERRPLGDDDARVIVMLGDDTATNAAAAAASAAAPSATRRFQTRGRSGRASRPTRPRAASRAAASTRSLRSPEMNSSLTERPPCAGAGP